MGAFCILQNFFQRNFCFRPAFEKVVCIITRKGEVLPPFDRKEVRTWNLIAENFKSNVPFKVSVNGCCTTKRATPTTKSDYPEIALVPYPVIVAASKGDPDAMKIVLQHFSGYIASLSMRKLYDERGNVYYGVDEDIRERLQARLMRAILTFRADE